MAVHKKNTVLYGNVSNIFVNDNYSTVEKLYCIYGHAEHSSNK
jgi:hypothetical protein